MKIIFFGTPEFARIHLQQILESFPGAVQCVVTQPDRPSGRGMKLTPSPVKELALQYNIPVLQPEKISKAKDEFLSQVRALGEFDLGIVVAFGQILPKEILDLPKFGCVNVHASLLPRWRGAAPIQHAIIAGDTESGVCLMKMEEGLDTGPVYATAKCLITEDETGGSLHDKLAHIGSTLLVDTLPQISTGSLVATGQPSDGVTYASKIKSPDLIINWERSASSLQRTIRAFAPAIGMATILEEKRLKIFQSEVTSISEHLRSKISGSVLIAEPGRFVVKCGAAGSPDAVLIKEVQLEGKKRMTTEQFLNGVEIAPETRLGDLAAK